MFGVTNPAVCVQDNQPLYMQVYQVLRSRLEAGRWVLGQTLPPIPALMIEFQASRTTVRQGLSLLESEGIVRKRRGLGTTVEKDMTQRRWVNLPTTLRDLVETISSVKPRVLNLEHGARPVDVPLCADERLAANYVRMRRLHLRDGQPYCLIDLILDSNIYGRSASRFRKYPVISVMDQIGVLKAVAARQQLTIRSADVDEAGHLSIEPGAPVADVRRTIVDSGGTVVYAAVVLYPSRTVRLDMNLVAP